jgi:hypothetical protein
VDVSEADVSEAAGAAEGAPATAEQPETENAPAPHMVERGPAVAVEKTREPLTPAVRAEAPAAPAVQPEVEVKRPSVFADAPIERRVVEAPLPPPPPPPPPPLSPPTTELPPPAKVSPGEPSPVEAAPKQSGWEDQTVPRGDTGIDQRVPSVYRNGDGGSDGSVDEDDDDVTAPDDEGSSGRLEVQRPATDKEWDEAVTVWSFAELAQRGRERSSRDEARAEPLAAARSSWSDRRRWLWVTVGAAIACVAVLVTLLAHKLW